MPALNPILRGAACCALLVTTLAGTSEACEKRPQPAVVVTIADGKPVVNRDPIRACEGDTIRWVFADNVHELSVVFKDPANSPFDWDRQTGATVTGTVRAGAAQDSGTDGFKYDVVVDGQTLDPKIIVEP